MQHVGQGLTVLNANQLVAGVMARVMHSTALVRVAVNYGTLVITARPISVRMWLLLVCCVHILIILLTDCDVIF